MKTKIMELERFEYINNIPYYDGEERHVSKNTQGYEYVTLGNNKFRLHRLIAKKYITNPEDNPCVDHIDGNKSNNNISNLEWVTYSYNSAKAYHNNPSMRLACGRKKGYKVIISEKNGLKKEHLSLRDCAKYLQRDVAGVYRCLKGEWSKCAGHTLKYKL